MKISAQNICFSYSNGYVIKNLNLNVPAGAKIGIMGASGNGKSTLLRLLSGLYGIQSGDLNIHGRTAPSEIRKIISLVFQNPMLFPGSILENITCGHSMPMDKIQLACRIACLPAWLDTLPKGLHTQIGERSSNLSGGQAQRIAIARAIAKDTDILLLDEAFCSLDADTGSAVRQELYHHFRKKTVIHISHDRNMLGECSKIYILKGGMLHEETASETLRSNSEPACSPGTDRSAKSI